MMIAVWCSGYELCCIRCCCSRIQRTLLLSVVELKAGSWLAIGDSSPSEHATVRLQHQTRSLVSQWMLFRMWPNILTTKMMWNMRTKTLSLSSTFSVVAALWYFSHNKFCHIYTYAYIRIYVCCESLPSCYNVLSSVYNLGNRTFSAVDLVSGTICRRTSDIRTCLAEDVFIWWVWLKHCVNPPLTAR